MLIEVSTFFNQHNVFQTNVCFFFFPRIVLLKATNMLSLWQLQEGKKCGNPNQH